MPHSRHANAPRSANGPFPDSDPDDSAASGHALEVQEHQSSQRPAKIVDARHGLLPAIAPLMEVNRRARPLDLV
jgi:hypothetical protein